MIHLSTGDFSGFSNRWQLGAVHRLVSDWRSAALQCLCERSVRADSKIKPDVPLQGLQPGPIWQPWPYQVESSCWAPTLFPLRMRGLLSASVVCVFGLTWHKSVWHEPCSTERKIPGLDVLYPACWRFGDVMGFNVNTGVLEKLWGINYAWGCRCVWVCAYMCFLFHQAVRNSGLCSFSLHLQGNYCINVCRSGNTIYCPFLSKSLT